MEWIIAIPVLFFAILIISAFVDCASKGTCDDCKHCIGKEPYAVERNAAFGTFTYYAYHCKLLNSTNLGAKLACKYFEEREIEQNKGL